MLVALVAVILWWPESLRMVSQHTVEPPAPVAEQSATKEVVANAVGEQAALDNAEVIAPLKPAIAPLPNASSPEPLATETALDAYVLPGTGEGGTPVTLQMDSLMPDVAVRVAASAGNADFFLDASPSFSVRSLLQERMLASIPWLHKAAGHGYTLQFLSGDISNFDSAESFLQVLHTANLLDQSYVCMSSTGSESYWTIKYGNFAGYSVAENFIGQLPEQVRSNAPFVQNISSVVCNTDHTIAALMLE